MLETTPPMRILRIVFLVGGAVLLGVLVYRIGTAPILQTLERCRWRIEGAGGAAQVLAMKSSTLRSRMLKLGISRPS